MPFVSVVIFLDTQDAFPYRRPKQKKFLSISCTVSVSRRSTKAWEDRISGNRLSMIATLVLPVQNRVPVMHEGQCIGVVSASGVQLRRDEQIANAGIAALS